MSRKHNLGGETHSLYLSSEPSLRMLAMKCRSLQRNDSPSLPCSCSPAPLADNLLGNAPIAEPDLHRHTTDNESLRTKNAVETYSQPKFRALLTDSSSHSVPLTQHRRQQFRRTEHVSKFCFHSSNNNRVRSLLKPPEIRSKRALFATFPKLFSSYPHFFRKQLPRGKTV